MKTTIYGLAISTISLIGAYAFEYRYDTLASVLFGVSIISVALVIMHWATTR